MIRPCRYCKEERGGWEKERESGASAREMMPVAETNIFSWASFARVSEAADESKASTTCCGEKCVCCTVQLTICTRHCAVDAMGAARRVSAQRRTPNPASDPGRKTCVAIRSGMEAKPRMDEAVARRTLSYDCTRGLMRAGNEIRQS